MKLCRFKWPFAEGDDTDGHYSGQHYCAQEGAHVEHACEHCPATTPVRRKTYHRGGKPC